MCERERHFFLPAVLIFARAWINELVIGRDAFIAWVKRWDWKGGGVGAQREMPTEAHG